MRTRTFRQTARWVATIGVALIWGPGSATSAGAADAEWSVGVASVKITPQKPVVLAGYASRTKPHEAVDTDLYAKALAFQDRSGNRAVLVTAELCILPREVAEPVRARIAERAKLDPAGVVLSVSHTHSAPAVSLTGGPPTAGPSAAPPPTAGPPATRPRGDRPSHPAGEPHVAGQRRVHAQAPGPIGGRRRAGAGRPAAGHALVGHRGRPFCNEPAAVHRQGRDPRRQPARLDRPVGPGAAGGRSGRQGAGRAVWLRLPLHDGAVEPPRRQRRLRGYAQAAVRQKYPGAEALFMAGCGGDANPYPRQGPKDAAANGEALAAEVARVLESKLQPVRGPLGVASVSAELPLQTPDRAALEQIVKTGAGVQKESARQMLATLDAGGQLPRTYAAPVGAWQFGKDLTLVTLPNEVVVDYVPRIEQAVGPLRLWVAAYCQEVAGYIPSRRVLAEGGYETRGLYVGVGWFAPEAEDALTTAVREAAVKAGRAGVPEAK